ncbi:unnamed protein product [Linum tenue]|uniref:Uncharacterized protein n=1 Tax=Linum tenue TaxID=586396 RepID=A0AAV0PRR0_9ROSI|nr:unnamed protein product [Linum tenue]
MSAFKLQNDNQFVRTVDGSPDIHVVEYMDDLNAFDLIHVSSSRWRDSIAVGPSAGARFKKLEVHGVTIQGSRLEELVKDLTWVDPNGRRFFPVVNRQGLCLVYVGCEPIKRVRINDHFGWSKYGVKPVISTIWSIWDMSSGAVLVAPPIAQGGDEGDDGSRYSVLYESSWKKIVEEKDKTESLLRKCLEEKEKENAALKAALKALSTDDHV